MQKNQNFTYHNGSSLRNQKLIKNGNKMIQQININYSFIIITPDNRQKKNLDFLKLLKFNINFINKNLFV